MAVVAVSAIQNTHWLPELIQFILTDQAELVQKPFSLFGVLDASHAEWRDLRSIRNQIHKAGMFAGKTHSEGQFAGALDIPKVPSFTDRLKFRLSILPRVWSEGDHRDWNAIRLWTESLAPVLHQGGA